MKKSGERGGERKEVQPDLSKTSFLKEFKMRGGLWGRAAATFRPLEREMSASETGLERLGGGWQGSGSGRRLGSHLES